MTVKSYFFNAVKSGDTYDRTYNAEDLTGYLEGIVGSGVMPNPANCLQVVAGSGMQVIVKAGTGFINGYKMVNTADYPLSVPAAEATLNRIDRVVFYCDKTNRKMGIKYKAGVANAVATPPQLTRTQDMQEYSLAEIRVNKQVSAITTSNITDTRLDSDVCGVVQGLIHQVDTSTLFQQQKTQFNEMMSDNQSTFNTWFAQKKTELQSDAIIQRLDDADEEHAEIKTYTDKVKNFDYFANGTTDNIELSDIVQTFLTGSSDGDQMCINVYGAVGCTAAAKGTGTASDPYIWFDFGKHSETTRRIIVDFRNAKRFSINATEQANAVLFGGDECDIRNCQGVLGGAVNSYFFNGKNVRCENSQLYINATGMIVGATSGKFIDCRISCTSTSANQPVYGFNSAGDILILERCVILAYATNANTAESVAVRTAGSDTTAVLIMNACNCPLVTRGGYKQSEVVKINSGYFSLTNNILGKAATLYTTGTGKTETGTMIISKPA